MSWGTLPGEEKIETEVRVTLRPQLSAMRFKGLNAVVTGGGRGFGSVLAQALAYEGANVVLTYNTSKEEAEKLSNQIKQNGAKSMAIKVDITQWDEVKNATEKVWNEFGPIDVLINNSGDIQKKQMSWRDITEDAIDSVLSLNVKGTMFVTHEIGSRMLKRKTGSIVNIASNVITTGSPRAPQYAASKYAMIGITKSYALAFAPWVRVNAACPGHMDTEALLKRPDMTPERRKWIVDHTPLKRIAQPAHVVPLVLFLASDDSINMTGNTVLSDGGFSMPAA